MITAVQFDTRFVTINPACGRVGYENYFLADGQDMIIGPGALKLACDDATIRPLFVPVPKDCAPSDVCQLRVVSAAGDGAARDCVVIVDSHRRLLVLEARGGVSAGSVMIVSFETHRLVQMEKAQRRQFGLGSIVLVANLDEQQRRLTPFLALVAAPVCFAASAEQREMWGCAMTHMHNNLFRYIRFCFSAGEFRPHSFDKIPPKIRALGLLPGDGEAVRRFTLTAMQPKAAMAAASQRSNSNGGGGSSRRGDRDEEAEAARAARRAREEARKEEAAAARRTSHQDAGKGGGAVVVAEAVAALRALKEQQQQQQNGEAPGSLGLKRARVE